MTSFMETKGFSPHLDYRNNVLNMDFYEVSMANAHFKLGRHKEQAVFDVFFRKNPGPNGKPGGYTITCGQWQIANYLLNFKFDKVALDYLLYKGFDQEFINYLAQYRWEGSMYAMPEGTIAYPNEPVIRIQCDMIGAFLIETYVLQTFNFNSLIATKANRIVRAADGRAIMEFGGRRAQGSSASLNGARAAIIGGCIGTANCLAEAVYGSDVKAIGTMSHAWVESFPSEIEAFRAWAEIYPENVSLLVDTYNALKSGVPNVIKLDNELKQKYPDNPNMWVKGIRLDSGDLAYQSKKARRMMDQSNKKHIKIIASNSLDEESIRSLLFEQKAPIDTFGVGEKLITSADCPVLGGVYKLVAIEENGTWIPKMKCSDSLEKAIIPGFKRVYRIFDEDGHASTDIITLKDEIILPGESIKVYSTDLTDATKEYIITPSSVEYIFHPFIINGKKCLVEPTISSIASYVKNQLENVIWDSELRSSNPHVHYVDMTEKVYQTRNKLYNELHNRK